MPKEDMERLNFWVSRELADAVRQKLLDHKRATRERITITDICTKALQDYIQRGETAQAVLEKAVRDYLKSEEGKEMKTTKTTDRISFEDFCTKHGVTNSGIVMLYPKNTGWDFVGWHHGLDVSLEEIEPKDKMAYETVYRVYVNGKPDGYLSRTTPDEHGVYLGGWAYSRKPRP